MNLIYFIKDSKDEVWGVAPNKIEAIKQINWFLPKGNIYKIESMWYR